MKILASRHEMTYEDYVESGRFTPDQLDAIQVGFNEELTPKEISVFAQPEYSVGQMAQICGGFYQGLTFREVLLFANPEFNADQMFIIRDDLEDHVAPFDTISLYAKPEFDVETMEMLHQAVVASIPHDEIKAIIEHNFSKTVLEVMLENLIDWAIEFNNAIDFGDYVEEYVAPKYSRMSGYFDFLNGVIFIFCVFNRDNPLREAALDICLAPEFDPTYHLDKYQITELVVALDCGVPEDIVRSYAKPEFSEKFVHMGLKDYMNNHGL